MVRTAAVLWFVLAWGLVAWLGLTLVFDHSSLACPVPGNDSTYGQIEWQYVPLGGYCRYDDPVSGTIEWAHPGWGTGLVELYVLGLPALWMAWKLRRRRDRPVAEPPAPRALAQAQDLG